MEKEKKNEGSKYGLKGSSLWGLLVFAILIFVDQITKVFADAYFNAEGAPSSIAVFPNVIELCISYNRGIAFGSFGGSSPFVKILIIVGTFVMMAGLAVLYFKIDKRRSFLRNALVFVVAGGIGNLIDRVYYRIWDDTTTLGVRDMVRVDFSAPFDWLLGYDTNVGDFGICNFADFFIVGGAIALLLAFLFFDRDAFFPVGKYKALAKEAEEKEKEKEKKETKDA